MAAGDVTSLARRKCQRDAAKTGLHGIKRGRFGIDADKAFGRARATQCSKLLLPSSP